MTKPLQLEGQRFGRLVVLERSGRTLHGDITWKCQCDCGKITNVLADSLRSGKTKSCGCLRSELRHNANIKHGHCADDTGIQKYHPIYNTWGAMKTRCFNSSTSAYPNYGGRGITICDEWKDDFKSFYDWSISNGWERGLTLDRIDNNGNYEPSNCRWVNRKVQNNNRRNIRLISYSGKTQSLTEWAKETGISKSLLRYRLEHWTVEEALTKEVM